MSETLNALYILEKLPIPLVVFKLLDRETRDFEFVYANQANQKASRVDIKEFIGTRLIDSFPGIYELGLPELYLQCIEKQEAVDVGEIEFGDEKVNYIKRSYRIKAFPLTDNELVILYEDVTSLKKAENELRKKNEILEEKNKSLEEFAYITSHDLQEPLGTIASFVEMLLLGYKDLLDDQGEQILDYIGTSTLRVKGMVHNILQYSRLGSEKEMVTVDCNVVLSEIRSDLKKLLDDKKVDLKVDELPSIVGAESEIRMLFQNLITNAIKYQSKDNVPEVGISVKEEVDRQVFSVRDNGIGIAEENQKKIFRMFQRLHLEKEYEGVGIGLANCQKIVDGHKGEIWVESELGKGSTFYFSIPK
ncbi:sensor histidine kinase [Flammeovirga aprica]|uniref:histidine kinase n=1 Tax=Flammeovirga aprica JL-4 TaxID=694437 RepID=A0A7X9RTH2_9BACT|nr:ATP-binding protein [Flammeovirga aprica]NME67309.1 GHKL domain-containing protein [Flammeovirga aprica JL-4]